MNIISGNLEEIALLLATETIIKMCQSFRVTGSKGMTEEEREEVKKMGYNLIRIWKAKEARLKETNENKI